MSRQSKYLLPFVLLLMFAVDCSSLEKTFYTRTRIFTLDSSSSRRPLNASEPHVVINRRNPDNIVGGSILDNVYFTLNSGDTWTHTQLFSPYGAYGDPVLISDDGGRIYYFHLSPGTKPESWLEGIVMQYSDNGGKTWSPGVLIGKNLPKQQDKPWPALDNETGRLAVSWTEFDRYKSSDPRDKSRILISFSDDRGYTWTPPVRINDIDGNCLDDDFTVEGAVPLFDNAGNVYVVWAFDGKIWFDYSDDGGKTWHRDRVIARQKAGWNFVVAGIYRANGLPNFFRDKKENFYVIFGDKDPNAVIRILYSTDKGQTWKGPYTLPHNGRDQFFPAAAYDEKSHRIVLLYYDRSRTQGTATETVLRFYSPGKGIGTEKILTSAPFIPDPTLFFGDYIGIDARHNRIAAVWTEIRKGRTYVKAALLD